jgi:hypothetical protein
MTSREEIERQLADWTANNARRDSLVSAALGAGITPNRIHTLTGIARTTIYRIKENVMQYAYRIDVTGDGETWTPYRDDARGVEVTDANPDKLAHLILTNHLADCASVGEDCDGTRVLLWRGTEGLDTEAVASAEYDA